MYTRHMKNGRKHHEDREQKHEFIIKYKHQTIGEKEEKNLHDNHFALCSFKCLLFDVHSCMHDKMEM